jgi:hypothetical protein
MADCNCKAKTGVLIEPILENKPISKDGFIKYFVKSIGFLFSLILLPFIMVMIIKFLFQTIVLSERVDLKAILQYYFKKKEIEEDDDDDYLELNEDEVEMLNVEKII